MHPCIHAMVPQEVARLKKKKWIIKANSERNMFETHHMRINSVICPTPKISNQQRSTDLISTCLMKTQWGAGSDRRCWTTAVNRSGRPLSKRLPCSVPNVKLIALIAPAVPHDAVERKRWGTASRHFRAFPGREANFAVTCFHLNSGTSRRNWTNIWRIKLFKVFKCF